MLEYDKIRRSWAAAFATIGGYASPGGVERPSVGVDTSGIRVCGGFRVIPDESGNLSNRMILGTRRTSVLPRVREHDVEDPQSTSFIADVDNLDEAGKGGMPSTDIDESIGFAVGAPPYEYASGEHASENMLVAGASVNHTAEIALDGLSSSPEMCSLHTSQVGLGESIVFMIPPRPKHLPMSIANEAKNYPQSRSGESVPAIAAPRPGYVTDESQKVTSVVLRHLPDSLESTSGATTSISVENPYDIVSTGLAEDPEWTQAEADAFEMLMDVVTSEPGACDDPKFDPEEYSRMGVDGLPSSVVEEDVSADIT